MNGGIATHWHVSLLVMYSLLVAKLNRCQLTKGEARDPGFFMLKIIEYQKNISNKSDLSNLLNCCAKQRKIITYK